MTKTFPLFKVHVDTDVALALVKDVFVSGFINEGSQVTELTNALSDRMGTHQMCLLNSCTSALTLALRLADVGPGDEVITTPMTCVASNTPIVNAGAKIVWADVDPNTGMIDPSDVRRKITERTKAVIAVAWAGTPPELEPLYRFTRDWATKPNSVKLILDAAHAFDAEYNDNPIHAWADMTTYSFQAIKHFTTGDGGALVCKDPRDFARAKALKWFGLDRDKAKDAKGDWKGQQWDVDIVDAGYKFNMNNVAAAIGLSQLPHISTLLATHRRNAALYNELFDGLAYIKPALPPQAAPDTVGGNTYLSSHWVYTVLLDHPSLSRDEFLKLLNASGIMAGVVHVPNDDYTAFKQFRTDLPGVRSFSSRQLSLPCGWWLSEDDIRYIASQVSDIMKKGQ